MSGLDPNNTFINLVGTSNLDPDFLTQLHNIKYRGSTARIFFILKSLPKIEGLNPNQMETNFSICPTIESLERASDSVKYGKISKTPYVEFNIPSILNQDLTSDNKHILSATVQYAPYNLRDQIWDDQSKSILEKKYSSNNRKCCPKFFIFN